MKIDELISELEQVKEEHGNINVETSNTTHRTEINRAEKSNHSETVILLPP